eukprot:SAG31_NODE_3183_length_4581_cov_1.629183_4_plen_319_part_00
MGPPSVGNTIEIPRIETTQQRQQRIQARLREIRVEAAKKKARKEQQREKTNRYQLASLNRALVHAHTLANVAVSLRLNGESAKRNFIGNEASGENASDLSTVPITKLNAAGLAVVEAVTALRKACNTLRPFSSTGKMTTESNSLVIAAEQTLLECHGWATVKAKELQAEHEQHTPIAGLASQVAAEWRAELLRGGRPRWLLCSKDSVHKLLACGSSNESESDDSPWDIETIGYGSASTKGQHVSTDSSIQLIRQASDEERRRLAAAIQSEDEAKREENHAANELLAIRAQLAAEAEDGWIVQRKRRGRRQRQENSTES